MKNSSPKISVTMAVYNQNPEYLRLSIESILQQTFLDFELIIVDDGSYDSECLKTLDLFLKKDSRIRVFRNKENLGIPKTRNRAIKESNGQYIAIQDSDDIAHKNRLQMQYDFFKNNSRHMLCATWAHIINASGEIIGDQKSPQTWKQARSKILSTNTFIHSSCMFRKEVFVSLGGYSEDMRKCLDYDLLLKIMSKFPVATIPKYLCSYRTHEKNVSLSNNKEQEYYALLARKKALLKYGYSKWEIVKLIRPYFFYYCIPTHLKNFFIRILWKI